MKLVMPDNLFGPYPDGFCIDNIFFPPGGTWKFFEQSSSYSYAPNFNDQPNTSITVPDAPAQCFPLVRRPCTAGDANIDAKVNVGDVVYIINFIFKAGPGPNPSGNSDANADTHVNVADAVYLINFIFKAGLSPRCP